MDINHLDMDPWKLIHGLRDLYGYEVPNSLCYATKHRLEDNRVVNANLELQPFEIKKESIVLKVIPYTIDDIGHNPRLVKTIKADGISIDNLVEQISTILLL